MEKKPKVSICKKCGYGIPVRAESCRRCATPAEKKEEMKLQVKKINTEQKSAAVEKSKKPAKKPSTAKKRAAKNSTPKKKATPALRRHTRT